MPASAAEVVEADFCVPLAEIAAVLDPFEIGYQRPPFEASEPST
jgi:hypothetical protein